ncbi:hypothetical protein BP5796_11814 [Coleophoma crateriformis]|uniref:Yeast cell wall synthesis Kre9/Knh1-like N-terminal domain-containing protein n=1 Tax=Coleophoma crateriformis TaxID=565419 RepID=A0A3D8QEY2_9HELO|nr:hypothetical protein BP5796_11814 [Coleophoma crateriformis]
MQYSTSLLFAALASIVAAQNPFTFTTLTSVTAGQQFNITWAPSTGTTDTVSLVLRQGNSANLDTVETIAAGIQNTGFYLWTPSTTLVNGPDYAFEIVDDGNTAIVNYSNQFSISSPNTVTPSTTATSSSASSTGSTVTTTTTSGSSTSTGTSTDTSTGTSTGTASSTASATGKSTSASKSSTSTATSSSATATTTPTSINSGASLKVGGGMLALVGAVMAAL